MANLDDRVDNHDIMQKFKAFKVAEIEKIFVLLIPSKLNQGLPKNFSQPKDIFLVIGKSGVKK